MNSNKHRLLISLSNLSLRITAKPCLLLKLENIYTIYIQCFNQLPNPSSIRVTRTAEFQQLDSASSAFKFKLLKLWVANLKRNSINSSLKVFNKKTEDWFSNYGGHRKQLCVGQLEVQSVEISNFSQALLLTLQSAKVFGEFVLWSAKMNLIV